MREPKSEIDSALDYLRAEMDGASKRRFVERNFGGRASLRTLQNLRKFGWRRAHPETREKLLEFYRSRPLTDPRDQLARSLRFLLRSDEASWLQKAAGSYRCFRLGSGGKGLITGKIRISADAASPNDYWFEHKSEQLGHHEFEHSGPVVDASSRIYLLGVGMDFYGPYFRPMILSRPAAPHGVMMHGLVLTETANGEPIAARTVVFSEALYEKHQRSHPQGADQSILEMLSQEQILDKATGATLGTLRGAIRNST